MTTALQCTNYVSFGAFYQRQTCSPGTLLSGGIRFMRIFMGVLWGGGLNWLLGGQNWRLLVISVEISFEPLQLEPILLCIILKCPIGCPVTLKWLTLNDLEMPFYAKIRFHRRFDHLTRLICLAFGDNYVKANGDTPILSAT